MGAALFEAIQANVRKNCVPVRRMPSIRRIVTTEKSPSRYQAIEKISAIDLSILSMTDDAF